MKLTKGILFEHKKWLTENRQSHLLCEVTAVRQGVVYWRPAGTSDKATMYFDLESVNRFVGRIVS